MKTVLLLILIKTETMTANKDKYVLLRGREHQNVFWTNNKPDADYDEEGYDVLFTGNTSEEMITQWDKYNPSVHFRF